MTVRVMLADDHAILRAGLTALMSYQPDIQVVGETGDGLEVIKLVAKLRPDVLVLDLSLPGMNGLEIIREVTRENKIVRIIVLSMYPDIPYVATSLRRGAKAYVVKDSTQEALVEAIRTVMRGDVFLSPPITQAAVENYLQKIKTGPLDPIDTLTPRELQVLYLIVDGMSSTEIAERLCISPRTVESHRSNIYNKIGVTNQAEMVRYAVERGVVIPKQR